MEGEEYRVGLTSRKPNHKNRRCANCKRLIEGRANKARRIYKTTNNKWVCGKCFHSSKFTYTVGDLPSYSVAHRKGIDIDWDENCEKLLDKLYPEKEREAGRARLRREAAKKMRLYRKAKGL